MDTTVLAHVRQRAPPHLVYELPKYVQFVYYQICKVVVLIDMCTQYVFLALHMHPRWASQDGGALIWKLLFLASFSAIPVMQMSTVVGVDDAMNALREVVLWPTRYGSEARRLGLKVFTDVASVEL